MSLKLFHLVFISLAVLCCAGFGGWCLVNPATRGQAGYRTLGIVSFLIAAGLVTYEVSFLRKYRGLR